MLKASTRRKDSYTHLEKFSKYRILVGVLAVIIIAARTPSLFAQLNLTNRGGDTKGSSDSANAKDSESSNELNRHSFGLGLGQTFLSGKFKHHGDNGITGDLFYNYTASYSFELLGNLHMSEHKLKTHWVKLQGAALGIKAKLFHFDAFSPYALGGMGFYRPKVKHFVADLGEDRESEVKTAFGFHIGAGADLQLNNHFSVGILGHYHNPFDIKQDVGPIVEGSYFKLLMMLMYAI